MHACCVPSYEAPRRRKIGLTDANALSIECVGMRSICTSCRSENVEEGNRGVLESSISVRPHHATAKQTSSYCFYSADRNPSLAIYDSTRITPRKEPPSPYQPAYTRTTPGAHSARLRMRSTDSLLKFDEFERPPVTNSPHINPNKPATLKEHHA